MYIYIYILYIYTHTLYIGTSKNRVPVAWPLPVAYQGTEGISIGFPGDGAVLRDSEDQLKALDFPITVSWLVAWNFF